jgi:hypothetical protein
MTLVLSLLTRDHVVQVSDRRLVFLNGPNAGKRKDDNTNKAVVICNRVAFAYTGLAEILNQHTDDWLLETVQGIIPYRPLVTFNTIAHAATEEFKKIRVTRREKRHAFVGVGWAKFKADGVLEPYACSISNALDDNWYWLDEARDDFRVRIDPLPKGMDFAFECTGQQVDRSTKRWLGRQLRKCLARGTSESMTLIRIMGECIHRIAAHNVAVGNGLTALSIPFAATASLKGLTIPLGPPYPKDCVLSFYYPAERFEAIYYGPHYTCGGISFKGAEIYTDASRW